MKWKQQLFFFAVSCCGWVDWAQDSHPGDLGLYHIWSIILHWSQIIFCFSQCITVWMYACMNSCMSLWTKASLFVRYKQQTHLVLFREIWFGLKYSLFVNVKHPVFILNMLQLRIYKNTTTQCQWWSWNNTSYTSYMSDHVWIWIFISSIHFGSLIFANLPQHPVWGKSRVLGVTADIFWLGHMNSLKHEWRRVVEWLQGCLRLIIDLISHWPWGL